MFNSPIHNPLTRAWELVVPAGGPARALELPSLSDPDLSSARGVQSKVSEERDLYVLIRSRPDMCSQQAGQLHSLPLAKGERGIKSGHLRGPGRQR